MYIYYNVHEFKNMFVFVVVTGFFHDNCTLIYILKKNYVFNFLVKHISVFFNHVLLCVFFHHLPVLCDLLRHIYTYCTYIKEQILDFVVAVYVYFQCILYVLQIFLPHFILIIIHVQAPNPPGPFTPTHLRNLTAFIQSGDAYLP